MLGKLYVHIANEERYLLVLRSNGFPHTSMNEDDWRIVAVGVEPADEPSAQSLRLRGFCEYEQPSV